MKFKIGIALYLLPNLNLLTKTFPQRNPQGQMVALVDSVKCPRKEPLHWYRIFQEIDENRTFPGSFWRLARLVPRSDKYITKILTS